MPGLLTSRLPPLFLREGMRELLSCDGMVYGRCPECSWEHLVDIVLTMPVDGYHKALTHACQRCGYAGGLTVARHDMRIEARCLDCGHVAEQLVGLDREVTCPECWSGDLEQIEISVKPPFPETFGEIETPVWRLVTEEPYTWGVSGVTDSERLEGMRLVIENRQEPQRYHFLMILFAQRLVDHDYPDTGGSYIVTRTASNLYRSYFQRTHDAGYALSALALLDTAISLAPNTFEKALSQRSFAMCVRDLLRALPESYVDAAAGLPGIRHAASVLASEAASAFAWLGQHGKPGVDLPGRPGIPGIETYLAVALLAVADLLRSGEADDSERRLAIEYYGTVLGDPEFVSHYGAEALQGRALAISNLDDPEPELLAQAAADLKAALTHGGSDVAYQNRWLSLYQLSRLEMQASSDRHAGLGSLEEAAAIALQQLGSFGDERQLLHQAERLVEVFEMLATKYADFGWNDHALSAVELTRGSTVRLYSMIGSDRAQWVEETSRRWHEDRWPWWVKDAGNWPLAGQTTQPIDDYFDDHPIGPAVKTLLRAHADVPTAFLCEIVAELKPGLTVVSALLCYLTGPDEWVNKRWLWRPGAGDLAELSSGKYVPSGKFRERLLGRARAAGARTLIEPVAEMITESGAERLIVSLPGALSRLPVEAFPVPGGAPGAIAPYAVTYLPSVRVGADLSRPDEPRTDLRQARVLVLGYEGEDMPGQADELAALSGIWGGQVTIIPGTHCTKKSVLTALQEPYDIIHITAHGTFNADSPLDSALHFCRDFGNDGRRVTASDLLVHVVFETRPIVILSACHSATVADSRTNSFHGIAGSMFRAGARGLIGSRWPIADEFAAEFMRRLHSQLRNSSRSPDLSVRDVAQTFREEGLAEYWSAFGYFGII